MASIGDRPNLKICIDNTEEGSESEDNVRLEADADDVIVEADAGSESNAPESYVESDNKWEHSDAEEDDEIERVILEANIPPEELRELSPEPLPLPVSEIIKLPISENIRGYLRNS